MESRSEDGPQEEMEKWGPQEFRRTCDPGSAPRENGEVPFLMGKLLGSPWFITASNCWTLTVNLELKSDERGCKPTFFTGMSHFVHVVDQFEGKRGNVVKETVLYVPGALGILGGRLSAGGNGSVLQLFLSLKQGNGVLTRLQHGTSFPCHLMSRWRTCPESYLTLYFCTLRQWFCASNMWMSHSHFVRLNRQVSVDDLCGLFPVK
jgi:hypothetical protein